MNIPNTRLLVASLAALLAGLALGAGYSAPVAHGQGGFVQPALTIAATAVAGGSQAWSIDPRTSQVILCRAGATGAPACVSTPMPGAAMR